MDKRSLGSEGLVVSTMGLGCLSMSDFYCTAEESQGVETIGYALELGIDFLDTADCYGPFTNERLVGRAIHNIRDQFVVSTKWGVVRNDRGEWLGLDCRPERAREACEDSLRRLGIETIDLWYLHLPDPNVPIEESVGAMAELVHEGKVRFLGISNVNADQVSRAHAAHPISAVQNDYSLAVRDDEAQLLPLLRDLHIGFVPFSPLGRGLLTGAVRSTDVMLADDFRRSLTMFADKNLDRNLTLVATLEKVAHALDATPAQVALAWVLAQGDDVVPIPGTAKRNRLEENAAAARLSLTQEQLDLLDQTFRQGAIAGLNNRFQDEPMLSSWTTA